MSAHENEPWAPVDEAAFAVWRTRHLATPFDVATSSAMTAITWLLVGFFALLAAAVLAAGANATSAGLAVLMLGLGAFLVWMTRRATARSIRRFDGEGVRLGDGRRLPWSQLLGVETHFVVTESGRRRLWRSELQFRDAVGWIVPNRTRNLDEVLRFLETLPVPQRHRSRNR